VSGTHWIRGWVGLRAGQDDVEERKFLTLPGPEFPPLGHLARSQSLYRLCYPVSQIQKRNIQLLILGVFSDVVSSEEVTQQ
jgi:hypothetical protein